MEINLRKIEKKWQGRWEKAGIFEVKEKSGKKKYYVLEMYPYPSSGGLHMGHAFNYILGDIYARFKRMQGNNVLYPMGYDSLGLPAENAAIKAGIHPKKYTESSIKNFVQQQKSLGLSYDWNRLIMTHDSGYYRWDQWIFLKMLERGIAFRKRAPVNFCSRCNTVLANEQVHNGKCWRHKDTDVELRQLEQWFLKITDYARELYDGIEKLVGWPDDVRAMQRNWIGKSSGININFKIHGEDWPVFTTRPDTIYGVTFMVISAQHPRLGELVTDAQRKEVEKLLKKIKSTSEKNLEDPKKEGAFTGAYAVNPLTAEEIPVYAGNFVVADYGSGMVMAVPAHDQRDFEFAKKYKIPIKEVVEGGDIEERAFTDEGRLINSGKFNGLQSRDAIKKISDYIVQTKIGRKVVQYKLRDWLISRQRYWGTPIPIIYCGKCGIVPVPENQLPVKLPEKVKFGKGNPLESAKEWVKVKCPECKSDARRETDTMDTFVNSSWYFLRYTDNKNKKQIFDKKKAAYWMPVDQYIGGKEHACMHLIYFRFYTKFLRDLGLLKIDEPAVKLFNQGMLHGKDGHVMSKSRGNVMLPEKVSDKYGIDTARLFLVSNASPDKDIEWSDKGIQGSLRFVRKAWNYFDKIKLGESSKKVESKVNRAIKEITEDVENLRYNLAVIKLRALFGGFGPEISKKDAESFLKLLSPFCPHIAEEIWEKLGNKGFLSLESWPKADEKKIDKKLEEAEKIVENTIGDVLNILKILKERGRGAKRVYIYVVPNERQHYDEESLNKKINKEVKVYAVNSKEKYDPENKSKKAKPGKPGIYIE